ncbi:MAG TPA: YetF domain-containing protein [Pyrinomonadaceae bacterium]|jgi:uncharacterized membrane protein YcaP (DUF421 family)|nr:YetF domain-containing protein [Pyrinomonadaceae bacterium]
MSLEALFNIDWRSMFVPQESILAVVTRGTLMYLGMFILLRIFRRQAGSVSIADLLLIVIIADAAQNGMAGDSKSVTEAITLIGVIIFWDYFIDWLGFKSILMSRLLEPQPLLLVKNGRMMRRNMESEMITEEELTGQLRKQGVEHLGEVKECYLESNGEFSVIQKDNGKKATK